MTNDIAEATRTALLNELARGVQLRFPNAEQLFREASLLRESGTMNRALFLHQISMDDCATVELPGAWPASLLMGTPIDISKLALAILLEEMLASELVKRLTIALEDTA